MKHRMIRGVVLACASACLLASAATPEETITPLLSQAIANIPGRTFTSAVVDFPPRAKADPHRHGEAFVYAYVLSGTVRSQLDEEPAKIYHAGDSWYEAPGTHHPLTENPSRTAHARLLVVFVGPTGVPLKIPDPH